MQSAELFTLSDRHPDYVWQDDIQNKQVKFRNERLDWYKNNPENSTAISYAKLDELSEEQVLAAIDKGYKVEKLCRITGYYSKMSGWNNGKIGEAKDRRKWTIGEPELTIIAEAI